MDRTFEILQVLSYTLFIWHIYLMILILFSWIWNLKIFPSFVLHTFHLIYQAQDSSKIPMDWKFQSIPSFVLQTFHLIYLIQDCIKFSILYPPQYLYIFHGLDIEGIPSFVLHTFHLTFLSYDTYTFFTDLKFENNTKFCPPHFPFDIPSSGL